MASAKAWYWIGLGVMVLSIGCSNTARRWLSRASLTGGELYARSLAYVDVAEVALGRTQSSYDDRMPAEMDRLDAVQDRIGNNNEDLVQAKMDRLQALVDAKLARACNRQRLVEKVMRGDQAMRMVRVMRTERAIPVRMVVGPHAVTVNGQQRRVVVCPEQTRIEVPRVRVETPELPSAVIQPEENHDPI